VREYKRQSYELRGFKGDFVPLLNLIPPLPARERGIKGVRVTSKRGVAPKMIGGGFT